MVKRFRTRFPFFLIHLGSKLALTKKTSLYSSQKFNLKTPILLKSLFLRSNSSEKYISSLIAFGQHNVHPENSPLRVHLPISLFVGTFVTNFTMHMLLLLNVIINLRLNDGILKYMNSCARSHIHTHRHMHVQVNSFANKIILCDNLLFHITRILSSSL